MTLPTSRRSPVSRRLGGSALERLLSRSSWTRQQRWWTNVERDVGDWFSIAWQDCRKAASCAIEICYLAMPTPPRSGVHPYRTAAVGDFTDIELEAARHIQYGLQFIQSYVDDSIMSWTLPDMLENYRGADHVSRLYHVAVEIGDAAWHAGYTCGDKRWHAAGEIVQHGCEIVQKWAANSQGGGHVPNIMLRRIAGLALDTAMMDFDVLSDVACKWRFRDALGDDMIPTEELRLAFQAAWEIAEYDFAYRLFESVEDYVD